jgi:hypothetical protein
MSTQPTPRGKIMILWTHFFTYKRIRSSFRNAVVIFRIPDIGQSPNYVHSGTQLHAQPCDQRRWENEGELGVRLSLASIPYTVTKLRPEIYLKSVMYLHKNTSDLTASSTRFQLRCCRSDNWILSLISLPDNFIALWLTTVWLCKFFHNSHHPPTFSN